MNKLRFKSFCCSKPMKVLFNDDCNICTIAQCPYGCKFYDVFYSVDSYGMIRIAYNNAFRILHNTPRYISVRSYQNEDNIELLTLIGQGGSSDADVSTFWCKKLRRFRNLQCVRTDKGEGVELVRTFCRRGREGINFTRFCADIFYGRPLMVL